MKLTEYLQSYYGLSREDFNKLPKRAKSVLRQYHATYDQNLQKFDKPADYKYKVPMSLDHLLEIWILLEIQKKQADNTEE